MYCYRNLIADDAEAWRRLRQEGTREFPLGFLLTEAEAEGASLDRCREILDAGTFRGVFRNSELVGFCGYRPQWLERIRHRGEIGPFFVMPSHHGTGAAGVLLKGVIAEARQDGIVQLELGVDPDNHRAIRFYEREGFRLYGTHPDAVRMDGVSHDELLYRLKIERPPEE